MALLLADKLPQRHRGRRALGQLQTQLHDRSSTRDHRARPGRHGQSTGPAPAARRADHQATPAPPPPPAPASPEDRSTPPAPAGCFRRAAPGSARAAPGGASIPSAQAHGPPTHAAPGRSGPSQGSHRGGQCVVSSFGQLDQSWLLKFLEHRIADPRVLRLIQKWLAAGVIENGNWSRTERGTAQGASASPLLANVYLHYVFDLWAHQWRGRHAHGDVIIVRYADDYLVGFESERDARQFLADLRDRLARFSLELAPEKTRLIEFGRFAAEQRETRGLGKPETFQFLGFTHICGKTRSGRFQLKRITDKKRLRA
ncbi:MAG: hypothetical protein JOZ92_01035, partial [Candidatus Dormibacteraeota bacterium]|nr:hypothetical protein [Candidatus Dormibacteraeota bacterium]